MAIEQLTIKRLTTPPHVRPEVAHIQIDFAVGEASLAGDKEFIRRIKSRVEYMPKEPCQSQFLIHVPAVANWTAKPYHNKEDFKVLLFTMRRYIEGDRDIEWVKLDKPLGEHVVFDDEAFTKDWERVKREVEAEYADMDRDKDLMVAQNPPPYNVKKP